MINNWFHYLALQTLSTDCSLQSEEEVMIIRISSLDSLVYMKKYF